MISKKECIHFSPADNGLNPVWSDSIELAVFCPPMAYIRFAVYDEDMFGDPNFIAQAVYPLCSLKQGKYLCNQVTSRSFNSQVVFVVFRPSLYDNFLSKLSVVSRLQIGAIKERI